MRLDAQLIQVMEDALSRGNRLELIPLKDDKVKVLELHRVELNQRPASKR